MSIYYGDKALAILGMGSGCAYPILVGGIELSLAKVREYNLSSSLPSSLKILKNINCINR